MGWWFTCKRIFIFWRFGRSHRKNFKFRKKKIFKICNEKFPLINVGSKECISIRNLAFKIKDLMNYKGKVLFNKTYPNGVQKKNLDISRVSQLGWGPKYKLDQGLPVVLKDFYKRFSKWLD